MNLKEKIPSDLKNALREKKTVDLSVLRMLQSAIRNKEIEKKKRDGLTDEEIVEVISSEIKKRKEAIEEYTKGQRQDLADKEKSEFEVLMSYMPKQMEEIEIQEVGAIAQGELGKVMKILMPRIKGKADGALVNKVVREELQKLEVANSREIDMRKIFKLLGLSLFILYYSPLISKAELKIGEIAPLFKASDHEGKTVDLNSLKGKWVVLYFYPKDDTPGCTIED